MRAGRCMAVVAVVVTGVLAPSPSLRAAGGELFDLMPRLDAGTGARYSVALGSLTRGTGAELPDGGMTARVLLNATVRLEVREHAGDELVVVLTYERISMTIDPGLPETARAFDTGGPPEAESGGEPGPSLRLMVGAESRVLLAPDGTIRDVIPPHGLTPTAARGAALKLLTTADGLREWLGPVLSVHAPDRAAPTGSRWTHATKREPRRGLETRMSTSYHLVAAGGEQATVNVSGSGVLGSLPGVEQRGVELKECAIEGAVLWDLKSGLAAQVDTKESEVWASQPEGRAMTTVSVERQLVVRRLEDPAPGHAP